MTIGGGAFGGFESLQTKIKNHQNHQTKYAFVNQLLLDTISLNQIGYLLIGDNKESLESVGPIVKKLKSIKMTQTKNLVKIHNI